MNITYLSSSTVIIESSGVKILTDPWLIDGEYYGSWSHVPPLKLDWNLINSVNAIYLSHIHPDHFSRKTFEKLNKKIPVYIHNYQQKFLKFNLENLGFEVVEIDNGQSVDIEGVIRLAIWAADNCNPELCGLFMGCGKIEGDFGSTQIDSLAVISDDKHVILNLNDCPYELARNVLPNVLEQVGRVNLLLTGYAGAGPYPQCFGMDASLLEQKCNEKKRKFLNSAVNYIDLVNPDYYMPFAGTYTLSGSLIGLNAFRGVPSLKEARDYIKNNISVSADCILLNSGESFDLEEEKLSSDYEEWSECRKENYINQVLSKRLLDYESDEEVQLDTIVGLLNDAFDRFSRKRKEIGFISKTRVLINLNTELFVVIPFNGEPYYISNLDLNSEDNFVLYDLDKRLLLRILKGPRYGHWNNAEIGSHIRFTRKPDIFERGLYHCFLNFHT